MGHCAKNYRRRGGGVGRIAELLMEIKPNVKRGCFNIRTTADPIF